MSTMRASGQVCIETVDAHQAWLNLLTALLENGETVSPRDKRTKELLGLQLRFDHGRYNLIFEPKRKLNYRFMVGQWLTTLSGVEDKCLEIVNKSLPQYETDGRGGIYPSYGPKLLPQWPYVLKQLMDDRMTRQAVASIWEAQRMETQRYAPCTLSLQFLLRPRYQTMLDRRADSPPAERPVQLHTVATMRSSDAWLGIPYDIFNFTQLANIVAGTVGHIIRQPIELGEFILNLGSSHLYEEHWDRAREILDKPEGRAITSPPLPYSQNAPLAGLQQLLTRDPQPLEEKDWSWWPWPWKDYVRAFTALDNAEALKILQEIDRRNGNGN